MRELPWTAFKAFLNATGAKLIGHDINDHYFLYGIASGIAFECRIYKDDNADQSDFEENYLSSMNESIEKRDSDNTPMFRLKMAAEGSKYLSDWFEFETSVSGALVHDKHDGTKLNWCTEAFYTSGGVKITDESAVSGEAVESWFTYEPPTSYEIIGGQLHWTDDMDVDVRCFAIGVPDVPAAYGGSVEFLRNLNMRLITGKRYWQDGRVAKLMNFHAQNHTGKFLFKFKHPVGYKLKAQLSMEIFQP